ncbi:hypothetical protein ACVIRO_001056 [Rhizobium ruizarguesonis]
MPDFETLYKILGSIDALNVPFGTAFFMVGFGLFLLKQYVELKKENFAIRSKLFELSGSVNDQNRYIFEELKRVAGFDYDKSEVEVQNSKLMTLLYCYISGFVITLIRYFLSETFTALIEYTTFQVALYGRVGRIFGIVVYPLTGVLLTNYLFKGRGSRRDYIIASSIFSVVIPFAATVVFYAIAFLLPFSYQFYLQWKVYSRGS